MHILKGSIDQRLYSIVFFEKYGFFLGKPKLPLDCQTDDEAKNIYTLKSGGTACWVDRGKGERNVPGVTNESGNTAWHLSKLEGMGDEALEYK